MLIDYRSDTVTRPTAGMKAAMDAAPVGDDVFGEDPSVNALEARSAAMFGMEAGLFCPSGTMTNQIAIRVHTRPGDEVICDWTAHIYQYEGGGIAANSGASVRLLQGDRGLVTAQMVREAINPDDVHKPRTALISLENTSNRGGGSCYNLEDIAAIRQVADDNGLPLHLDGARLFNALIAKSQSPSEMGAQFHTISVCLSKGLGAPVGSVLLGPKDFIHKARRVRKLFGGGMRQAGSIAAAASYALDHHIERLAEDHHHASLLGETLEQLPWVSKVLPVETNILIFEVAAPHTASGIVAALKEKGILAYAIAPMQVRLVTHLDISEAMVNQTISIFKAL
ncbi:L-threonine aldolase [Cnuella takakiae]|uniref:L-threonine aldolase n=1 Tax=Cnuella takakiae TaxID=1302690 RepID=A0A1M5HFV6_9BACT|nr:GntG family PLP-dependent aldolase [Cnuella takakiae]OLY92858.1 threonine aldolase [Cnuella takakiae]SHG14869.1 L-threonine aldolase [Cnuella takakiae]